jgi:6-phosphogluconolactonase/glucosamine-6-phosphate isomerase/deaminase
MTIPAMLAAAHVFTMVPLTLKREILTRMIAHARPTADLPATILHRYAGELYVDRNSCPRSLLKSTPAEESGG